MAVLHALPAELLAVDLQASVKDVAERRHPAILVAAARPLAALGSAGAVSLPRVCSANLSVFGAAITVLRARKLALETASHACTTANTVAILASRALARVAHRFGVTMVVGRALLALARRVRARLAYRRTRIGAISVAIALPTTFAIHTLATCASMVVQSIDAHACLALVVARAASGLTLQAVAHWV